MREFLLPLAALAILLAIGSQGNADSGVPAPQDSASTCLSVAVWSLTVLGLYHRARR